MVIRQLVKKSLRLRQIDSSINLKPNVTFYPYVADNMHMKFVANNDVITFCFEGKCCFVPYFEYVKDFLLEEGFKEASNPWDLPVLYYPFFNPEQLPEVQKEKWYRALFYLKKEKRYYNFSCACKKYCASKNIPSIDENILNQYCLRIPFNGVRVVSIKKRPSAIYPLVIPSNFYKIKQFGGHYNQQNGIICFVTQDGNTYVSKNEKMIPILEQAGYSKIYFPVPFSNDIKIIKDFKFAEQFRKLNEAD